MSEPDRLQEKARSLFHAARTAFAEGDDDRGLPLLEQVLVLLDRMGDLQGTSVVLALKAEALARKEMYAEAFQIWEPLLLLLDRIGDVSGRSVTLDNMARAAARQGHWRHALELWEQALEIDTKLGGERDRAATLASIGGVAARLGDGTRAVAVWTEALATFERVKDHAQQLTVLDSLARHAAKANDWSGVEHWYGRAFIVAETAGDLRTQATLLMNIGSARLHQGDPARALEYWQRAQGLLEELGDRHGATLVLASMGICLDLLGDLPHAVERWQEALSAFVQLGDEDNQASMLGELANAAVRQVEPHRAVALWQQQLKLYQKLDDFDGQAALRRQLSQPVDVSRTFWRAVSFRPQGRPLEHESCSSLSEYDLAPASAPLFLLGELLATMHSKGVRYGNFRPGHLDLHADGSAWVVRATHVTVDQPITPELVVADFTVPFETYSREDFRAIVAGYARAGYEVLDHERPGFTDALLDLLGAPSVRPRPRPATLDISSSLQALGLKLTVLQKWPGLSRVERPGPTNLWYERPVDAFLLLLSLLILEVDCEAAFAGGGPPPASDPGSILYQVLQFLQGRAQLSPASLQQLPEGSVPVVRLALQLARTTVFYKKEAGAANVFGTALPLLRAALCERPDSSLERLADMFIEVGFFCARWLDQAIEDPTTSKSCAQKSIILLQYLPKGALVDEMRLAGATHALNGCSWYRNREATPEQILSVGELGIANSLLLTYRDYFQVLSDKEEGRPRGTLWSAALRGVHIARSTVRQAHAALEATTDPETGAMLMRLLQVSIKSYAIIMMGMKLTAAEEEMRGEWSGWGYFFGKIGDEPTHLEAELQWITEFRNASVKDDFSVGILNDFVRRGACFLPERASPDRARA